MRYLFEVRPDPSFKVRDFKEHFPSWSRETVDEHHDANKGVLPEIPQQKESMVYLDPACYGDGKLAAVLIIQIL